MMGRMTGKSKVSRSTLPLDLISHIFVFCKYFFEEYKKHPVTTRSIDRLLWDSLLSLNSQSEIRHISICGQKRNLTPWISWFQSTHSSIILCQQAQCIPISFKHASCCHPVDKEVYSLDPIATLQIFALSQTFRFFLFTILEKAVLCQLHSHFVDYKLLEPFQSAYLY